MPAESSSGSSSRDRPSDPVARRIDLLADEYERRRRQAGPPDLAAFLARLPAEAQDVLRAELAVVEAELRVQEGQAVRPDDLAAQFGIPAEPIHAWLDALQAGSVQETGSSPFWTPAARESQSHL